MCGGCGCGGAVRGSEPSALVGETGNVQVLKAEVRLRQFTDVV